MKKLSRVQIILAEIVISLTVGVFLYRWLVENNLEQTSALFIGLPALLALFFSLIPMPKSIIGMTVQGTAVFLSISGIFLGEGFICILMAAPLFFGAAIIVGWLAQKDEKSYKNRLSALFIFLPFALEGVHPLFTFPRHEKVIVKKSAFISSSDIEQNLAHRLEFKHKLPLFLQMGFPLPSRARGEGLAIGSQRCVHFSGGEGQPGDLCFRIKERDTNKIVFERIKDDSPIVHWLTWKKSVVQWKKSNNNKMEITWTITYDRELDPAWYFAPFERYAVRLAGEYLIKSYFGI